MAELDGSGSESSPEISAPKVFLDDLLNDAKGRRMAQAVKVKFSVVGGSFCPARRVTNALLTARLATPVRVESLNDLGRRWPDKAKF